MARPQRGTVWGMLLGNDGYRRPIAPTLFREPFPVGERYPTPPRGLVRYRHGDDLVTLSADAVPDELASAFPLTSRQWEEALLDRAVDPDTEGSHATVTFLHGRVVYRGSGLLCRVGTHDRPPSFVVRVARRSDGERWPWLAHPANILSVTAPSDPSDAGAPSDYRLVPTLAEACRIGADVEVRPDEQMLLWFPYGESQVVLRARLDAAYSTLFLEVPPSDEFHCPADMAWGTDMAPGRAWFWTAFAAATLDRCGGDVTAGSLPVDGAPEELLFVSGTYLGFDLDAQPPCVRIERATPAGFEVVGVALDTLVVLSVGLARTAVGGFRQASVSLEDLPAPDVMRSQALESLEDGGEYLFLWHPDPDGFGQLHLQDVRRDGDLLHGTRPDGERIEVPLDELLAVQDPQASVQRFLAQKLAWWDLLPDLLAPFEGRAGTLYVERDGRFSIEEDATYLGQSDDEGGFRFALPDGIEEIASDSLIGFEV